MKSLQLTAAISLTLLPHFVEAQTGYPMVMSLKPTSLQIDTSSEIEFHTRYSMFGA